MTKEIKGVFVRLPISDDQAREMYAAYCKEYDNSSRATRGTATQAAIMSIGTPVTGDDIPVVTTIGTLRDPVPCVRQSDAQAKIAALEVGVAQRDQSIEKLEDELSAFRVGLSELIAKEVAALKGDVA